MNKELKEDTLDLNAVAQDLLKEDAVDLATVVRDMLLDNSVSPDYITVYDNSPEVKNMVGLDMYSQRTLMNKFWFMQLSSLEVPTIKERFCLVPDGLISDWIRLFKTEVLPTVILRQLPRFEY